MQQLLQIKTIPGQYELTINNAKLEYDQEFIPTADVSSTNGTLSIKTTAPTLHISSYEARKSLGFSTVGDRLKEGTRKASDNVVRYIKAANELGRNLSRIDKGVTIGSLVKQKILERPSSITMFIPSTGVDISWDAGDIQMDYEVGTLDYNWKKNIRDFSYVPGSVQLNIIQKPSIEITYLGSPLYVPRSSDPNYEESPAS